jgi:thiol:disulfide interchange protein DsbC
MAAQKLRQLQRLVVGTIVTALLFLYAPFTLAADELDLTKAVKVGSGKTMVIEFTDPDCPYCKKAEGYFQAKPQVTRYIYFIPLPFHPASKGKVQYILSAKDKAKAYREVVSGNFDNSKLAAITPEGIRLQKQHVEIAKENHIKNTPTFMIYGRIITGFDLNKLDPLLK